VAKPLETAIVLVLEDALPFDDVRRELAPDAGLRGIPFHITLLYPFVAREDVTDAVLDELSSFFGSQAPLEFALTRIGTFRGLVYAVPEPDAPLRRCMGALHARFPDWPPYAGAVAEPIPHATLAEGVDEERLRPVVERRLAADLPTRFRLEEATLLEEFAPDRWHERARFALRG
jgi:2'-5' RNA ligase